MARPAPLSSPHPPAAHRLPLLNWGSLRLNLYWAYQGTPLSVRSTSTVASQTAWLLRRGAVRFRWRDRVLSARGGQWIVLGADRGEHEFSEGSELLSICFRAEWFTGQAFFDDSAPVVLDAQACPGLEQAADRLVRVAHRLGPQAGTSLLHQPTTFAGFLRLRRAYFTWLESLTKEMHRAGVGLRPVGPSDERVLHGLRLLEEWPMQQPFDERVIAAAVGLSRAHFSRLMAVELGLSPKAYYERRRFNAARERLLADETPIKTITYQLGFHDTAHFSNWFRQRAGISPTRFRTGQTRPWDLA